MSRGEGERLSSVLMNRKRWILRHRDKVTRSCKKEKKKKSMRRKRHGQRLETSLLTGGNFVIISVRLWQNGSG